MDQNNGGILGKINTPTTTVASGVWSLDSQFEAQSSSIWPLAFPQTTFTNACRFNDDNSDYLDKSSYSTPTSTKQFTWSCWFKLGEVGARGRFFDFWKGGGSGFSYGNGLFFTTGHELGIGSGDDSNGRIITNRKFRDPSAWYHVVAVYDSPNSTAGDRLRLYVNGERETSFSASVNATQNWDYQAFTSNHGGIGTYYDKSTSSEFFDGYMTEVIFIDGQALDQTSFGTTNPITGVWEPIAYAGTYGNNGFRLDFANSSALGTDVSGNSNTFTANNLNSTDQSTDTCSNNFITLSPIDAPTNSSGSAGTLPTLSNGNLSTVNTNSAFREARSSVYLTTGKWYWEYKMSRVGNTIQVGVFANSYSSGSGERRMYQNNGYKYISSSSSYGATYTTNDIIGVALNLDDGEITFYKNGVSQGVAATDLVSGMDDTGWTPSQSTYDADSELNFGSPPYSISSGNADANGHGNFEYAVPSGYFAICTKNLAEYG